jgi:hypothetical protein
MSEVNPKVAIKDEPNVELDFGVMVVGSHTEDDDRNLRQQVQGFVESLNRTGFQVKDVKVRFGTEGAEPMGPPKMAPGESEAKVPRPAVHSGKKGSGRRK